MPQQTLSSARRVEPAQAHGPDLAFALQKQGGESKAARLTAKGEGELAAQILEIALGNEVPVRQDADLARLLEAIELDSDIPLPALAAVADILTYLYEDQARRSPHQNGTAL